METYVTEDQQVEAIKQWWKENGNSVLIGAVLGLSVVFGMRVWNEWQGGKADAASALYQQMESALEKEDLTLAQSVGTQLRETYPSSTHAVLGAFVLATLLVNKDDLAGARGQLEWAVVQATEPSLRALGQLRLARVVLEQGDRERALTLGEAAATAGFQAEFDELRGDLLLGKGDAVAARAAYQAALVLLPAGSGAASALNKKLDNLGR